MIKLVRSFPKSITRIGFGDWTLLIKLLVIAIDSISATTGLRPEDFIKEEYESTNTIGTTATITFVNFSSDDNICQSTYDSSMSIGNNCSASYIIASLISLSSVRGIVITRINPLGSGIEYITNFDFIGFIFVFSNVFLIICDACNSSLISPPTIKPSGISLLPLSLIH